MKITDLTTAVVRGHGWNTLIKIETDEGITGIGECIHGGGGVTLLLDDMKALLVGENPMNWDMLFEKIRRRYIFDGALAGNVVTALSGIDIALLDLVGKALGVPVYQLLGGKFRDSVRLYADCHAGKDNDPASAAAKAKWVVEQGFDALKFDLDDPSSPDKLDRWNPSASRMEVSRMVELVAAVREAVGPNVDLCVDMHGRYDIAAACEVARKLEPFNLMWLEEPIPPENIAAMREVKLNSPIPICAGESLYLRWGFRDLIEQQAVDHIMPDLPKCCGLTEGKKIANMAELYYIGFSPHNVCGPIGTVASAHCCGSVPNFLVLEWHWMERAHWHELVIADPPIIQGGYLPLSDKPGLGVELNEEAARKYQKPGTLFFGQP
ncbi:MAG: mandelate racemase/muconate lactonizing enzyme family protein [Candidatus Poribacteria bacterium]|nr:mandelate racemase/muconate lactonizing enzyme family protein [Candidatus Poribacteria bacterium]